MINEEYAFIYFIQLPKMVIKNKPKINQNPILYQGSSFKLVSALHQLADPGGINVTFSSDGAFGEQNEFVFTSHQKHPKFVQISHVGIVLQVP